MDDWGDPWAEEGTASKAQLPSLKEEKPEWISNGAGAGERILNAISDEAQWGAFEEGEGSGGWGSFEESAEQSNENFGWNVKEVEEEVRSGRLSQDMAELSTEGDDSEEIEVSEDVTLPEKVEDFEHARDAGEDDDEESTPDSLSPSETSRRDGGSESPRTSFDDSRLFVHHEIDKENRTSDVITEEEEEAREDPGNEVLEQQATSAPGKEYLRQQRPTTDSGSQGKLSNEREKPTLKLLKGSPIFTFEISALHKFFPPPAQESTPSSPPHDTTISNTSTRKAWHRLTRRQPLRSVNSGADPQAYVRVTWPGSRVRSDTLDIVSRWAAEERANPHLPAPPLSSNSIGKRGSVFGWDRPANGAGDDSRRSIDTWWDHRRRRSSASTRAGDGPQRTSREAQRGVSSPLPTFNWSSAPPQEDEGWGASQAPSPAASPPLPSPPPAPPSIPRRGDGEANNTAEARPRSKHSVASASPGSSTHKRGMSALSAPGAHSRNVSIDAVLRGAPARPDHKGDLDVFEAASTPPPASPPTASPPPPPAASAAQPDDELDPWAALSSFDSHPPAPAPVHPTLLTIPEPRHDQDTAATTTAAADFDDFDDFGEMVQSPPATAPAPVPLFSASSPTSPPPPPTAASTLSEDALASPWARENRAEEDTRADAGAWGWGAGTSERGKSRVAPAASPGAAEGLEMLSPAGPRGFDGLRAAEKAEGEEEVEAAAVAAVLRGVPDLGYMLR